MKLLLIPRVRINLQTLLLGFAAACVLCGCSGGPPGTAIPAADSRTPSVLILALDRSAGDSVDRETELRNVNSIVKSAAEAGYPLDMWAFDAAPSRIFGPAIPESEDDTFQLEAKQVRQVKGNKEAPESRPALLLKALGTDSQLTRFQDARITVITHGESPIADQPMLAYAGQLLAKKPGWRIAVLGVDAANIRMWQTALGPSFGKRLDIATNDQVDALLRQNRDE